MLSWYIKKFTLPFKLCYWKRQPKYPSLKKTKQNEKTGHLWRTSDSMPGAGSIKIDPVYLLYQKIKFARRQKCAVSWLLTSHIKMGLGPGTPPSYQAKGASQPAWEHLPVLDSAHVPLSCLSVSKTASCQPPTASCHGCCGVKGRNRLLHLAHRSGPCRPSPCVRCGRWPAGPGEPMSPPQTHLLCLSAWVKHCFTVKVCELWFSVVTLNHGVGLILGLLLLVEWKSSPGGDNHDIHLTKLWTQRNQCEGFFCSKDRDSLSINKIINVFHRNSLYIFFKNINSVPILIF